MNRRPLPIRVFGQTFLVMAVFFATVGPAGGSMAIGQGAKTVSATRAKANSYGSRNIRLQVEPADGVDRIVSDIDSSQQTILVSAYLLSQHRIIRALERAAAQQVKVYVLLDRYPYGVYRQPEVIASLLQASGVHVKWSASRFQYSHAKFMVLDDRLLILSSANFTESGFSTDRDFVVTDRDRVDVRQADNIFRADWDRIRPVLTDTNMVVSPDNARRRLVGLIGSAHRTLDVYSEEVLDRGMVRSLAATARRGVQVRVLTATISTGARATFAKSGVLVRTHVDKGKLYLHAKALTIDGRLGFVGSENFSNTSLEKNRELGVIFSRRQAVRRLDRIFRRDWSG